MSLLSGSDMSGIGLDGGSGIGDPKGSSETVSGLSETVSSRPVSNAVLVVDK